MQGKVNSFAEWVEYYWMINAHVVKRWFWWFKFFVGLVVGFGVLKYFVWKMDKKKNVFGISLQRPYFKEIILVAILALVISANL
jgi:hypothetical protein